MSFTLCAELVVLLMSEVVASQVFLCKEASLSCPVITYSHRQLKGFTFKTIHFASLVSCGLLCQRDPRCVSTNIYAYLRRGHHQKIKMNLTLCAELIVL